MKHPWKTKEERRVREVVLGNQYDHWFPMLFDSLTKVQAKAQIKRINTELDAIYTQDEKEGIPDPYFKMVLQNLALDCKLKKDDDDKQLSVL